MSGETRLERLLSGMGPELLPGEFVFCTFPGAQYGDFASLRPVAMVRETEGMTLIVPLEEAEQAGLVFDTGYREIVLRVHSSLEAVGLSAAVSSALAGAEIPANIVAGARHDHLFVPARQAGKALEVLRRLQADSRPLARR